MNKLNQLGTKIAIFLTTYPTPFKICSSHNLPIQIMTTPSFQLLRSKTLKYL